MTNERTPQPVSGLHHVTAIASDPQRNLDFYTGLLGLRLVKLTVNFDDPGAYHFYYGDALGRPGTILTFFSWPGAQQGHVGAGQVAATALAIPPEAVDFWAARLRDAGVAIAGPEERDGQPVIRFNDPDGLALELSR
jgi:glyoxalase family protein